MTQTAHRNSLLDFAFLRILWWNQRWLQWCLGASRKSRIPFQTELQLKWGLFTLRWWQCEWCLFRCLPHSTRISGRVLLQFSVLGKNCSQPQVAMVCPICITISCSIDLAGGLCELQKGPFHFLTGQHPIWCYFQNWGNQLCSFWHPCHIGCSLPTPLLVARAVQRCKKIEILANIEMAQNHLLASC